MDTIFLSGMEFLAHHGCFDEEQIIGTRFIVDLQLHLDVAHAAVSDNLAHTVNYQAVYNAVSSEMARPSHLLEHVAGRIAARVLADFEAVDSLTVTVAKCNPPLGGKIGQAGVTFSQSRLIF